MNTATQELANVLREARSLLALPDNNFDWSSWTDTEAALDEMDGLIAVLETGSLPPQGSVSILFAPAGPIQEVSLSSGWGDAFVALADRCDAAVELAYSEPL